MVKKKIGDRSWPWPGGFERFNSIYLQEYLCTFYKCVCVCVCVYVRESEFVCVCMCKIRYLRVCLFVFHNIVKL